MKKRIALMLAAATLLGTACSKNTATENPEDASEVNYSYGLTDDGQYEGVTLADYVTLPDDYKTFTIPKDHVEVSEADWESYRASLMNAIGTKAELPDAVAENGSRVTIDFTGTLDGETFAGSSAEDVELEIGAGFYFEAFENSIVGHKAGDVFEAEVSFPEDYPATIDEEGNELDLANKTAKFEIVLKSVDEYSLTDEDIQEYFSSYNETAEEGEKVQNEEALKAFYMEGMEEGNRQTFILEYLSESAQVEIPQSAKDAYVEVEMQILEANAAAANTTVEELLEANAYESAEEYKAFMEESANEQLKQSLILLAIAEKEGIAYDSSICMEAFGTDAETLVSTYGSGYVAQNTLCYQVLQMLLDTVSVSEG